EYLFECSRYGKAPIGMRHQTEVREIFPSDDVDDVGEVEVEIDILAHEMGAFAEPGQGWSENPMTFVLQQIAHASPAPAAVPGAMNEDEGFSGIQVLRISDACCFCHPCSSLGSV